MENEEKKETVEEEVKKETNPNDEIMTFLKTLDEKITMITEAVSSKSEVPTEEPAEEVKEEVTEEVTEEQSETTDEELEDLASYLS